MINKLTGEPVSEEMQNVLKRLAANETVPESEIYALKEIKECKTATPKPISETLRVRIRMPKIKETPVESNEHSKMPKIIFILIDFIIFLHLQLPNCHKYAKKYDTFSNILYHIF